MHVIISVFSLKTPLVHHADADSIEFKKSKMGFSGSALTMKIKSSQVGKVIGKFFFLFVKYILWCKVYA